MSFKDFFIKFWNEFKEANKPENVKKRLQNEIEITKLKTEKEKLNFERRQMMEKRFQIGVK